MASVAMPTDLAVREPEENNRPRKTNLVKLPQKSSVANLYREIKNSPRRRTTTNNKFATTHYRYLKRNDRES